jgi:hypothetical protein
MHKTALSEPVLVVPNILGQQTKGKLVKMRDLASVLLAKPCNEPSAWHAMVLLMQAEWHQSHKMSHKL